MARRIPQHKEEAPRTYTNDAQRKADKCFYARARWREVRTLALRRQPMCECGQPAKHVHHKMARKRHPDLAYDLGNLEALCVVCHNKREADERAREKESERR